MLLSVILEAVINVLPHPWKRGRRTSTFSPDRSQRQRHSPPRVEPLEARELLATAIGMNLEHLSDYMGGWMFTDAFKQSRPWIPQDYDTVTGNAVADFHIPLDPASGAPTLLRQWTDSRTGHLIVQQVQTLMFRDVDGHYPSGTYTAWWQGDGTVTWDGIVNPGSVQLSTTNGSDGRQYQVAQFSVLPGRNDGILMTVSASSAGDPNPIHDAHLWMPDYNGQHFVGQIWQPGASFSPFHPLFLQRLAPFHNLRFMQLQDTVTSSLQHWSDRRPVNYETQQSREDENLMASQSTGGNTATTLNDATQLYWQANQWAGMTVQITSGTGAGQVRTIASNTTNQLLVSTAWDVLPENSSTYAILIPGPQAGRSTGSNSATTLNDATQTWTANQWAGLALRITAGTGAGQVRAILANTTNQLTLGTPWVTTPDATSTYAIVSQPGIAPEYLIELANELHADAWFNVPHMAQNDYLSGLARLVHNTLNPSLHVYLEWSNEAWNPHPGFDSYQWLISQLQANATTQDFAALLAQQATRAFGIWSQAFSDRPGQVIRVLAGQLGNDYYNGPLLDAMNQQGGNYDAFSVHAYFNPDPLPTNATTDQYLAALQASIPTTLGQLRTARALADQASTQLGRHIALVAYEGGPAMEAQFLPDNDPTQAQDTVAMNQANVDPRIYGLYSSFLNQLSTTGLDLLENFEYTSRVALNSSTGEYGALTYQDQPTADAPRYHALLDYLNGPGVAVANFVIGLDNQVYAQKLDTNGNPVGGYFLTQPGQVKALAAGTDGLGHVELWVIGLDDQVWAQTFDGAGNSGSAYFLTQPGRVLSLAVGRAGGNPELFAMGLDNQVYAQTFDAYGHSSSTYVLTKPGQVKSMALGALGSGAAGTPELLVIGFDDQVYAQTFDTSGQSTSSYFLTAAGRVKSLSVGALGTTPEVFVVGLDDQVYAQLLTTGGAGTGGYVLTGPGQVKAIGVGQRGMTPEVFVIGLDDQVYAQTVAVTGRASGPYFLVVVGRVLALRLRTANGQPEVFALGLDSQVYAEKTDITGQGLGGYFLSGVGAVKAFATSS